VSAVQDGARVYVTADPAGIGPTLDAAVTPGVRSVVVCGARPGYGKSGVEQWAAMTGRWLALDKPWVTRSAFRGRYGIGGRTVHVTRAEPWFGIADPTTVYGAARVLSHVLGSWDVRPVGTPGKTGFALLAKISPGLENWPTCPPEIRDLLWETTGQGRFEIYPNRGGDLLVGVDARFQYGALSLLELPAGTPRRVDRIDDLYAPSWVHVEWTPPPGARVGALPFRMGKNWEWPTDGGPWRSWVSGAELHTADECGYRLRVLDAVVWPERRKPLASWARALIGQRARVERMPMDPAVRAAVRGALRAMLVQTIGSLHRGTLSVSSAPADETEKARPEWSTALWGLARNRLYYALERQTAPLVACALDAYYVAGEPVNLPDDGKPGRWVETHRSTDWPALKNLAALYKWTGGE